MVLQTAKNAHFYSLQQKEQGPDHTYSGGFLKRIYCNRSKIGILDRMAGLLPGDPTHHGMHEGGPYRFSQDKLEEAGRWYLSRKEIEENSPSKQDGIDLKKETYLRKSYCTFLQDLGMRLKVPQVTIATAIIFCHRFFLRQSHAKNDRRTIATVCMFLAGKVEETPRPLKDVILVSYEIIHKKDPAAVQRIKQKEVYEQQKELILLGERVVLATLGFDLNVHHPYKPLVEAIKKFKVAQNALAQVAWNFVNDGLRTSLCLQFKPHHIAAGAIFLAAKFLKVKLPSDGEKVWWQEFDVTPRQLEEVSNQMLELYEQNRVPPSQGSELEGSAGGGPTPHRVPPKAPAGNEEHAGGTTSKPGNLKPSSSRPISDQSYVDNHVGPQKSSQNRSINDYESAEVKNGSEHKADGESKINQHAESEPLDDLVGEEGQENNGDGGELKEKHYNRNLDYREGMLGCSPQEAIKKIDKDKVKAALEKRRKSRGDVTRKAAVMDEDDLIERELEDGIELAAESEKSKRDKKHQSWSKHENSYHGKLLEDPGDGHHVPHSDNVVEEGELSAFDDAGRTFRSPKSTNRKRKVGSPHYNHHDYNEDRNRVGRHGYSERDHKRHAQDNHF